MRRRRHTLHVSTFPFLAVLLCTMGSLILVLLVMDRKAKQAAVARAQREAAQVAQERAEAAAARRAQAERKRKEDAAAWESKRQEVRQRLVSEEQLLRARQRKLAEQLAQAAERLRARQSEVGYLRQKVQKEKSQVEEEEKVLDLQRAAVAGKAAQADAADKELARMTTELEVLEQALRDLKAARQRDLHTYSVVPYKGKRGENRVPLYVECASSGLLFHPDRNTAPILTVGAMRSEVQQRLARQRERLQRLATQADPRPYLLLLVRPDGIAACNQLQGVLRELGVDFGYEFVDPDWALDFPDDAAPLNQPWMARGPSAPADPPGPATSAPAAKPLTHVAGTAGASVSTAPGNRGSSSTSPQAGSGTDGGALPSQPGVSGRAAGMAVGGLSPADGGAPDANSQTSSASSGGARPYPGNGSANDGMAGGIGSPGFGGPNPSGSGAALSGNNPCGAGPGIPGSGPGSGLAGPGGAGFGPANIGGGSTEPTAPTSPGPYVAGSPGDGPAGAFVPGSRQDVRVGAGAPGGNSGSFPTGSGGYGNPGGTNPGGMLGRRPAGSDVIASASQAASIQPSPQDLLSGFPMGQGAATSSGSAGAPGRPTPGVQPGGGPSGAYTPGSPNPTNAPGVSAAAPSLNPPGMANGPTQAAPTASASPPETLPPSDPNAEPPPQGRRPKPMPAPGGGDGGPGRPEDEPLSRLATPLPTLPGVKPSKKPPPKRLASLHGDRDWIIYVECRADSVVLYPTQRTYPLAALAGENNPLLAAVRLMIERRQGLVRPGDPPFRPHVRFLVLPENLRCYHLAFPALEALPVPKSRQNLDPEDDVAAIVAGS